MGIIVKIKKLTPPAPYNSRYKYPNTVYLVVDFNKPKAIYIGDILGAQEQKVQLVLLIHCSNYIILYKGSLFIIIDTNNTFR